MTDMAAPRIVRTAVLPLLALVVTLGAMISSPLAPVRSLPQELAAPIPVPHEWQQSLDAMDRELGRRDILGAEIAWRNAYGAALRTREWTALLAVGEGALRIGLHVGNTQPYQGQAREAWLGALFRARARGSLPGVLAVAEAFETLGDTDVVVQALHIADTLAARDASVEARRQVLGVRRRLLPGAAQLASLLAASPEARRPEPAATRS